VVNPDNPKDVIRIPVIDLLGLLDGVTGSQFRATKMRFDNSSSNNKRKTHTKKVSNVDVEVIDQYDTEASAWEKEQTSQYVSTQFKVKWGDTQ
jgi:hypothetical protein